MPVKVYTAQYRYDGPDRLDITVKGRDPIGGVFAPTWKMVMGLKNGTLTKREYTDEYCDLMQESWKKNKHIWQKVWNMDEVTFVCFCSKDSFCHRYILANMFVAMRTTYGGER
jgi:hypothetical protein